MTDQLFIVILNTEGEPDYSNPMEINAKSKNEAYNLVAQDVPAETIEKEREIARAQIELAAQQSGKQTKPEFVERQLEGRVAKVLKELVLEDQEFFMSEKNPKKLSVKNYLQEVVAKQLGLSSLKVVNFIRFERGN